LGGIANYINISVVPNQDGRIAIFVRGTDNAVWYKWLTAPGDPESWSVWATISKPENLDIVGYPVAALNGANQIEVFAQVDRGSRGYWLYRIAQTVPNGDFDDWTEWTPVFISDHQFGGARDTALDHQGKLVFFNDKSHILQRAAGSSDYGPFYLYNKTLSYVTAEPNYHGGIGVVGVESNSEIWYNFSRTNGTLDNSWYRIRNGFTHYRPAVVLDSFNRLNVFVHGTDDVTYFTRQEYPGTTSWDPWMTLGGRILGHPAAAMNKDGRLEVFVLGTDSRVYHRWENSRGGDWSRWHLL
jgi:hypothetical protein